MIGAPGFGAAAQRATAHRVVAPLHALPSPPARTESWVSPSCTSLCCRRSFVTDRRARPRASLASALTPSTCTASSCNPAWSPPIAAESDDPPPATALAYPADEEWAWRRSSVRPILGLGSCIRTRGSSVAVGDACGRYSRTAPSGRRLAAADAWAMSCDRSWGAGVDFPSANARRSSGREQAAHLLTGLRQLLLISGNPSRILPEAVCRSEGRSQGRHGVRQRQLDRRQARSRPLAQRRRSPSSSTTASARPMKAC